MCHPKLEKKDCFTMWIINLFFILKFIIIIDREEIRKKNRRRKNCKIIHFFSIIDCSKFRINNYHVPRLIVLLFCHFWTKTIDSKLRIFCWFILSLLNLNYFIFYLLYIFTLNPTYRLSLVSKAFGSAAEYDIAWDRLIHSDLSSIVSSNSKKALFN